MNEQSIVELREAESIELSDLSLSSRNNEEIRETETQVQETASIDPNRELRVGDMKGATSEHVWNGTDGSRKSSETLVEASAEAFGEQVHQRTHALTLPKEGLSNNENTSNNSNINLEDSHSACEEKDEDTPLSTQSPEGVYSNSARQPEEHYRRNRQNLAASIPPNLRVVQFAECIHSDIVNITQLSQLVWIYGVPSQPRDSRALAWKLLCDYALPDKELRDERLKQQRSKYWQLVDQLTVDPHAAELGYDQDDHPLSDANESKWAQHFEDEKLREGIQRDVSRTHPELHRLRALEQPLARILFVHSKCHQKLGYKQGMNELCAPLLFVFSEHSSSAEHVKDAEADTYYCFESIMQEMEDCFLTDPPDHGSNFSSAPMEYQVDPALAKGCSNRGIQREINELGTLLQFRDSYLFNHLQRIGVDTRFYALRWIRLWFSREFDMPTLLRIWDLLLCSERRLLWLRFVCLAILQDRRNDLLKADFNHCMKILLEFPKQVNVDTLLKRAEDLRFGTGPRN